MFSSKEVGKQNTLVFCLCSAPLDALCHVPTPCIELEKIICLIFVLVIDITILYVVDLHYQHLNFLQQYCESRIDG